MNGLLRKTQQKPKYTRPDDQTQSNHTTHNGNVDIDVDTKFFPPSNTLDIRSAWHISWFQDHSSD